MKTLSHVLQALFTVFAPPGVPIQLVQAKKYKRAGGTYASRKKHSVTTITEFVQACPSRAHWNAVFTSHAKKDDLSDALLLATWNAEAPAAAAPAAGAPVAGAPAAEAKVSTEIL